MKTFEKIIKAAIPNASTEYCDWLLWSRTSYPFGKVTAKNLYKAASRLNRAHKNGLRLCELCDNIAIQESSLCKRCSMILPKNPGV